MAPKRNPSLTWQQISAFRLARHNLLVANSRDPVAVSRTICGIQAQVMASAHMAVWEELTTFALPTSIRP